MNLLSEMRKILFFYGLLSVVYYSSMFKNSSVSLILASQHFFNVYIYIYIYYILIVMHKQQMYSSTSRNIFCGKKPDPSTQILLSVSFFLFKGKLLREGYILTFHFILYLFKAFWNIIIPPVILVTVVSGSLY